MEFVGYMQIVWLPWSSGQIKGRLSESGEENPLDVGTPFSLPSCDFFLT